MKSTGVIIAFLAFTTVESRITSNSVYGDHYSTKPANFISLSSFPSTDLYRHTEELVCHVNPEGKTRPPVKVARRGTKPKTREDGIQFATDNRQHFRVQFDAVDFTFNVFKKLEAGKVGGGGRGTIVSVDDVPALKGEGVAMVYFELEPCGLILPHAHPRATELIYAVDAEKLQVGFMEETNSRFIVNEISTGQLAFVPQGLLHYSQNVGCSKVTLVGFFNHENPGSWFVAQRLFDLPLGVSAAALDIDEHLAKELSNGLPDVSPVKGRASCLKKCHLPQEYMLNKYSQQQQQQQSEEAPHQQQQQEEVQVDIQPAGEKEQLPQELDKDSQQQEQEQQQEKQPEHEAPHRPQLQEEVQVDAQPAVENKVHLLKKNKYGYGLKTPTQEQIYSTMY